MWPRQFGRLELLLPPLLPQQLLLVVTEVGQWGRLQMQGRGPAHAPDAAAWWHLLLLQVASCYEWRIDAGGYV
jgi:hypothetical protein